MSDMFGEDPREDVRVGVVEFQLYQSRRCFAHCVTLSACGERSYCLHSPPKEVTL